MFVRSVLLWLLLTLPAIAQLPVGWQLSTPAPRLYQGSRDTSSASSGQSSGMLLGSPEAGTTKHALLVQNISATDYRNHRIRLSAKIRASAVTGRTGLWLRVDSADGEPLAFDNMADRPIQGDQGWTTVSLEIDVPNHAKEIYFGLLLCGAGTARVDDLSLAVVGEARPVGQTTSRLRSLPRAPINGDFER